MSKLTTVVKTLDLLKGLPKDINEPLPWPRKPLLARLERYIARDIVEWHEYKLPWIKQVNNQTLSGLCHNVITALLSGDYKIKLLTYMIKGDSQLPRGVTHRLILVWVLVDIQNAFAAFQVMRSDATMNQYHIREMALRYLAFTYELMLIIAQLLYPSEADMQWFLESWEYLKKTGLRDFVFDGPEDYLPPADPTLAGVIPFSSEVPIDYLPIDAGPPIYYRNEGPYGPTILRNYCIQA